MNTMFTAYTNLHSAAPKNREVNLRDSPGCSILPKHLCCARTAPWPKTRAADLTGVSKRRLHVDYLMSRTVYSRLCKDKAGYQYRKACVKLPERSVLSCTIKLLSCSSLTGKHSTRGLGAESLPITCTGPRSTA